MRPTVMSRDGMVVTPHYLASEVGLRILQDGGNAVEAAIAAAAAIAVVYPESNSIGGDNFWLIYDAGSGTTRALNASGRSGRLASLDYYRARGFERIPARGYAAALTVPGAVSGWHEAYGFAASLRGAGRGPSWRRLLEPAIHYAADGFPVSRHQAERSLIDFDVEDRDFGNLQRFEECRRIFCDRDGRPWRRGDVLVQADLARTLDLVAERGADAFYRGEIADRIVADLSRHDGVLTREDFHDHRANWVEPISVNYRGSRH